MAKSKLYCRAFQLVFALGVRVLPWRLPELIEGEGSFLRAAQVLRREGKQRPFVVASRRLCASAEFIALAEELQKSGAVLSIFSDVEPNPSVATVEKMAAQFRADGCDSILAVGGGSPIDAAKAAAARVVRPGKSLAALGGLLKVRRRIPYFIAVPTTAGTGSEATIAAVITAEDHRKYALSDLSLVPHCAILDPALTASLPPHITAQTGMDALTHAVECYLNLYYNTPFSRALARGAVVDIFRYLEAAYHDGGDLEARSKLLRASFDAGAAFTRVSVGNVHAAAHTLGGLYGVAHGLANAVLLPVILEDYGAAAHKALAELAEAVGIGGATAAERAENFIAAIRGMNERMGIPTGFDCIREEDLPRMTAWAEREANPLYPVPAIYGEEDFARVLRRAML